MRAVFVVCGQSESLYVDFLNNYDLEEVKRLLADSPGDSLRMLRPGSGTRWRPTLAGKPDEFVGRISRDPGKERGLNMWIISDNLLKGAAIHAVQIEKMHDRLNY